MGQAHFFSLKFQQLFGLKLLNYGQPYFFTEHDRIRRGAIRKELVTSTSSSVSALLEHLEPEPVKRHTIPNLEASLQNTGHEIFSQLPPDS
jgi:hypothetical protein